MRFYTQTHKHFCGIDLHARSMYVCILDTEGEVLLHRNMKTTPEAFLGAVAPYQRLVERLAKKHGKGKALSILCARLGRAVYVMLKRREPFDQAKFMAHS